MKELLKVRDLHVVFETPGGLVQANRGVNLDVKANQAVGIMGESGCGKTVLFLSLLRLQQPGKIVQGCVLFDGRDLARLGQKEMQRIRGSQIALVLQDHATALNPSFTVGEQLGEALVIRKNGGGLWRTVWGQHKLDDVGVRREIDSVLQDLALGDVVHVDKLLDKYPHQLSGGMRQRVLIAMALLARPRLLIADEPTTALDRATQMQTLALFERLRGRTAMLIISHDLDAISQTCDRVAVMYGGSIVERGAAAEVFANPRHPYTRLLLSCQKPRRGESLPPVSGDVLDLIDFPPGCSFHPRCSQAMSVCSQVKPSEFEVEGVKVACHLFGEEGRS